MNNLNKVADITDLVEDGRLTEPTDGKQYRYKELFAKFKELNRPLTDDEMLQYEIKE